MRKHRRHRAQSHGRSRRCASKCCTLAKVRLRRVAAWCKSITLACSPQQTVASTRRAPRAGASPWRSPSARGRSSPAWRRACRRSRSAQSPAPRAAAPGLRRRCRRPVPVDAALIFEVEVVKLNARASVGLPVRMLRQLLVGGADGRLEEAAGSDDDGGDGATLVPAPSLLRWASALRTPLPCRCRRALPSPRGSPRRARAGYTLELWRAVDGALPIARGAYGTPWDGATPLIFGGERRGWAPAAWGWGFWARRYGDSLVLSKQRAPIFDDDLGAAPLMAETSLREYIAYARAPADETAPLLYMNGWDVFAHPGSRSRPRPAARLDRQPLRLRVRGAVCAFGQSDLAASRVRQLMKLFVGPRGAIARMHQDNHRAHAWLYNLRGHKLYVVAAPGGQSERVGPTGRGSEHGGTTRGCRLDPLDGASRGERRGVVLHAAVLAPGETLVLPEGWWHYAASLTPSITLMCNFGTAPTSMGCATASAMSPPAPSTRRAAPPSPTRSATASRRRSSRRRRPSPRADARARAARRKDDRVVHSPFVYVREEPSTDAPLVTVARHGVLRHRRRRARRMAATDGLRSGPSAGCSRRDRRSGSVVASRRGVK